MKKKGSNLSSNKSRQGLVIFLTEKFILQMETVLENSQKLTLKDKSKIVQTFLDIYELAENKNDWKKLKEKYDEIFNDIYFGKIFDSFGLLGYFENGAVVTHGIGSKGYYTNDEFNAFNSKDEQFLNDSEFHSLMYFVRNNLHFMLNKIKEEAFNNENINSQLRSNEIPNDQRIKGKLTKDEIEDFFVKAFSQKMKNNLPILFEEDIIHFLYANFIDFNPKKEIKKFNCNNIKQIDLIRIINRFYKKHSSKTRVEEYAKLLKNNFSQFDNSELTTIKSNFSK